MYLEVFFNLLVCFVILPESIGSRSRKITPERPHATQVKTTSLRNAKSPMASCLRQGQKLTVIQEASAAISKQNKVGKLHENDAAAMPSHIKQRHLPECYLVEEGL